MEFQKARGNLSRVLLISYHLWPLLPPPSSLLPFRYPRQPGGERAPTHGHDWPVEQPEGAALGGPWGAEEAGRLTDGEAEAADGARQAAAGSGIGARCMWRASFGNGVYSTPMLQKEKKMSILTSHSVSITWYMEHIVWLIALQNVNFKGQYCLKCIL